ncbi:transmembrane protein 79-like [Amphiura filiformis]|uniref:transmembrane protein 79-like n=1 Tax=Amphiura filiformis TaxID=82378 RepID=UPI003B211C9D
MASSEQKPVDKQVRAWESMINTQVVTSLALLLVYFYVGYYYVPITIPDDPNMIDRMIYTFRWIPLEILPTIIAILVVGTARGNNLRIAGDPRKPEQFTPPLIAVHVRFLANTVEQTLIHVPGLFAVASYVQPENLKLIPLIVILFVIGRIVYWIGYTRHAFQRALGFMLTIYPSIGMHGYALFCLFYYGATYHGFSSGD